MMFFFNFETLGEGKPGSIGRRIQRKVYERKMPSGAEPISGGQLGNQGHARGLQDLTPHH